MVGSGGVKWLVVFGRRGASVGGEGEGGSSGSSVCGKGFYSLSTLTWQIGSAPFSRSSI